MHDATLHPLYWHVIYLDKRTVARRLRERYICPYCRETVATTEADAEAYLKRPLLEQQQRDLTNRRRHGILQPAYRRG